MANLGSLVYQLGVDTRDLNRAEGEVLRSAGKMKSEFDGIKTTVAGMFAGLAVGAGIKSLVDAATTMDTLNSRMRFSAGGAQEAQAAWSFLREQSNRLGVDLQSSAEAFTKFASAARGTALAGEPVKKVFVGLQEAISAMGLSNEEASGAMLALTQMLSKGKVQAEELRGQLGERIPGAFQIAARAMNMTTAELDKFMADGKLMAEDFLPKFAAQLSKEMASGLDTSTQTMRANLNRLSNAWMDFKTVLLNSGFVDGTLGVIKDLTKGISDLGYEVKINKNGIADLFSAISESGKAIESITIKSLKTVISILGEVGRAYNQLPDFIKTGLAGGTVVGIASKNPALGGIYGSALAVNEGLESANRAMGVNLFPTVQSLSNAYMVMAGWAQAAGDAVYDSFKRQGDAASALGSYMEDRFAGGSGRINTAAYETKRNLDNLWGTFKKIESASMSGLGGAGKEVANTWKNQFDSILETLTQLQNKRQQAFDDPLGRKAGGNQREDTENKIKSIMEQQSQAQERINALMEERNNAESDYAAYLADQALQEEEKKQALLQTQYNQEQQIRLQELTTSAVERAKAGKISEKEVQDSITQILRDQEQSNERINSLTFERERLQRALSASTDLDQSKELVDAISKIDNQLRPAVDHARDIKNALDSLAQARVISIDADIDKAKKKRDDLVEQFNMFGQEIKINFNTDEAKTKVEELGKLIKAQGITADGVQIGNGVGQGIWEDMEKVVTKPLPKGVVVFDIQMAKSPAQPWGVGYQELIQDIQTLPGASITFSMDVATAFNDLYMRLEEVKQVIPISVSSEEAVSAVDNILSKIHEIETPVSLNLDTSEAQARINSILNQLSYINGATSQYTIDMGIAMSPRQPFTQGYSSLLNMLRSIPSGSDFTIQMLMAKSPAQPWTLGYKELLDQIKNIPSSVYLTQYVGTSFDGVNVGTSILDRHARGSMYVSSEDFSGADPAILARLDEAIRRMTANFQGPSPFSIAQPSTWWMGSYYQDQVDALTWMARESARSARENKQMEKFSNSNNSRPQQSSINLGPINITIVDSSSNGRDLAISLADTLEDELYKRVMSGKLSKLSSSMGN